MNCSWFLRDCFSPRRHLPRRGAVCHLSAGERHSLVIPAPRATADLTKINNELEANWWPTKGQGFLDGSAKQTIKPLANGPVLKPGQSWNVTLLIQQIPEYKKSAPKQWEYVFAVEIDLMKQMPESNEKNNGEGAYAFDPCPK